MDSETLQREHYDKIAAEYHAHYGDAYSQAYRRRYFYEPMFRGVGLAGKEVLEAMCGGGESTHYLLAQGARVTGLDISEESLNGFRRRWPECRAVWASILSSGLDAEAYDCVVVVGGLHHVHPHVHETVEEVTRVLKPGGYFCFAELHAGSLPDLFRKLWYRRDHYFVSNEAAVDTVALRAAFEDRFTFGPDSYAGGIAYLLVYNSLVFRIPQPWKRFYAPALLWLERVFHPLQGKRLSCFVVSQWRKRDA